MVPYRQTRVELEVEGTVQAAGSLQGPAALRLRMMSESGSVMPPAAAIRQADSEPAAAAKLGTTGVT